MKCSGENVILRGIVHVVSGFDLHFIFYSGNLDCFFLTGNGHTDTHTYDDQPSTSVNKTLDFDLLPLGFADFAAPAVSPTLHRYVTLYNVHPTPRVKFKQADPLG